MDTGELIFKFSAVVVASLMLTFKLFEDYLNFILGSLFCSAIDRMVMAFNRFDLLIRSSISNVSKMVESSAS
jgi:hypothetical protein